MELTLNTFADAGELDRALAATVATALAQGIAERGSACLAVSGGRTPGGFFRALAACELDWTRVTVTLADERCVPETDESNNARNVRAQLLQAHAAPARFIPLYRENETPSELASRVAQLPLSFDAVVLGMGDDGHTASIFPDSPQRDEALAASAPDVLHVEGKAPVRQRITLSARRLLASRLLCLHITGTGKWQVLGEALAGSAASHPIHHFLNASPNAHVFWTR